MCACPGGQQLLGLSHCSPQHSAAHTAARVSALAGTLWPEPRFQPCQACAVGALRTHGWVPAARPCCWFYCQRVHKSAGMLQALWGVLLSCKLCPGRASWRCSAQLSGALQPGLCHLGVTVGFLGCVLVGMCPMAFTCGCHIHVKALRCLGLSSPLTSQIQLFLAASPSWRTSTVDHLLCELFLPRGAALFLAPRWAVVITGRMSSWRVGDLLCKLQVTSSKGTVVLEHIKALHCPCLSTDCSLPNPSTRIAGWCLPLPHSVPAVPWLFQSLGVPKLCGIKEEPHMEQRAEAPCFVSKSSNSPLPLRGSAHLQTQQMRAERLSGEELQRCSAPL